MNKNIFREEKVHATLDGRKCACGASGNAARRLSSGIGYLPPDVTCIRCIRIMSEKKS